VEKLARVASIAPLGTGKGEGVASSAAVWVEENRSERVGCVGMG